MNSYEQNKQQILADGFSVVPAVYSAAETETMLQHIEATEHSGPAFRKTKDLFAIRGFLKVVPGITDLIFNDSLNTLIQEVFGSGYFVIKSIYFDKPPASNWFVAYHQDLMITVNQKTELTGFGPWTLKPDQIAVQPPVSILEDNFTLRIHLDPADAGNGALKVVPGSHLKQIYRPETIDWNTEREVICDVTQGGVMLMKPLLLHASGRSTDNRKRRVIHIEFSKTPLPAPLQWSEYQAINGRA